MQLIAALALLPLLALGSPTLEPRLGAKVCKTKGSHVNLREEPSLKSHILGQTGPTGENHDILCFTVGDKVGTGPKADNKWLLVEFGAGYISNYYMEDSCVGGQFPLHDCNTP